MKEKLKRELQLIDIFAIASGAMISSGLFILPAIAYAKSGPAVVFAYLLAGILALPAMLAKAELSTAMPRAGGVYFFIERSMGAPLGMIGGLANWFSLTFKSAFALIGLGIFATLINPSISATEIKLIAIGFCLFFMIVNIMGVKQSSKIQVLLVLALIGILGFYVFKGFNFIKPERYMPFAPHGAGSIFATAGLVFVSFGGLTKICCVAEETKRPGRNIPLGMFLAFSIIMILYAAVIFVTIGLLDPNSLSGSFTPISAGANVFMGKAGGILLAIAGVLAFISTANAGILTASRNSMAMSRDCLLPQFLQKVNRKTKTPYISIIVTTIFMICVIVSLSLENLVKTASTLMILLFIFVNFSLIIMRESRIQSYRPRFKTPFYPWINIAGIIGYAFLIFEMGQTTLAITGGFIVCALVWYFVYARNKVRRHAALIHVIERITAKELVRATLPDELKEIIIERDRIVEDRFDKLIKDCKILDIEESLTMEEFFKDVAKTISPELGTSVDDTFNLLLNREKESSTVITPGLAIPHIVVGGEYKFRILLARCKEGIVFPKAKSPVKVVFVLAGTKDERNFHLRALAAIAEIAQAKNFDKRWLSARNEEELRNVVLLAERRRFLKK